MAVRSGFVSIVGRPNAGKSTLLNALLGQKLAIVTHKQQTTRTRIHGVLEVLLEKSVVQLKDGQRYFPKHQLTDQPERFLVAELIREKILMLTGEEVPYASAVVIEKYEEPASMKKMKDGKLPVTKISAAIFCERTGQKAILIGKQGEMLKRIGTAARKDIESLLGTRGVLELVVKVQ